MFWAGRNDCGRRRCRRGVLSLFTMVAAPRMCAAIFLRRGRQRNQSVAVFVNSKPTLSQVWEIFAMAGKFPANTSACRIMFPARDCTPREYNIPLSQFPTHAPHPCPQAFCATFFFPTLLAQTAMFVPI